MVKKGKLIELIFLILSILLIVLFVVMILREFRYDSCKFLTSSDLEYTDGKVMEYDFGRGALYITFSNKKNLTFTVDTMSVIDMKGLEKAIETGETFRVGFTSNAKHKDYRQLAFLESEKKVFVSLESHKKAVIKNYIIGVIGISFFCVSAIYLFFLVIKLIFNTGDGSLC